TTQYADITEQHQESSEDADWHQILLTRLKNDEVQMKIGKNSDYIEENVILQKYKHRRTSHDILNEQNKSFNDMYQPVQSPSSSYESIKKFNSTLPSQINSSKDCGVNLIDGKTPVDVIKKGHRYTKHLVYRPKNDITTLKRRVRKHQIRLQESNISTSTLSGTLPEIVSYGKGSPPPPYSATSHNRLQNESQFFKNSSPSSLKNCKYQQQQKVVVLPDIENKKHRRKYLTKNSTIYNYDSTIVTLPPVSIQFIKLNLYGYANT
ncbi:unnamed protein product, partial [Didymodactylos carnosus]